MGDKPFPDFDGDFKEGLEAESHFLAALGDTHYEHKHDKKSAGTGNLFIEYETKTATGTKLSGISTTKSAYWVTQYDDDCWFITRTSCIKALARKAILEHRHVWAGDNRRFHGALVPKTWLIRPWTELVGEQHDKAA